MTAALQLVLAGSGRMGREVALIAVERGHEVVGSVSRGGGHATLSAALEERPVDAVIDFTHADAVDSVVGACLAARVPLVTGTTGWSHRWDTVTKLVREEGGTLLHAPNFSLGVQVFLRVAAVAGELYGQVGEWDVAVEERHHRGKKDAPSGTALELARRLVAADPRKRRIVTDRPDGMLAPEDLHVASLRSGAEFGRHAVVIDGADDLVEIRHSARGRRGFALGAVRAAEWIVGRKGIFTIDDLLDDLLIPSAGDAGAPSRG